MLVLILVGGIALLTVAFLLGRSSGKQWDPKGKVVAITGASSGIGRELAYQYAAQGAKISIMARRQSALEETVDECRRRGAAGAVAVVGDVSVEDDCKRFIDDTISEFGAIDCLVLNAGISMGDYFVDLTDLTAIRNLMEVNYFGCVYPVHFALKNIIKSKGKIVCISSLAGKLGVPMRTGYCGSKWAVQGFFNSLRVELRETGVQVTMICPGVVRTDINRTRIGSGKLNMAAGVPVDEACNDIRESVGNGERELIMTARGKLASFLQLALPSLCDYLVDRSWKKQQMKK